MSINTTGYWALVMRALKETGDVRIGLHPNGKSR